MTYVFVRNQAAREDPDRPESTFSDYTIPTRLRIGWYFGTDRFEPYGEFSRCIVEEATYR